MFKRLIIISAASLAFIAIFAEAAFAFESVKFAIKEICGHMTGNLGGLLMTVAGIGGLASAAFGNFRASQSLIVTGIGAFAISAILSLYFPKAADECGDGGGAAGGRVAKSAFTQPGIEFNDALNNRNAAIAVAGGRDADFTKSAQLNQTGEALEEEMDVFDPAMVDFGDEF
jgi:hypothetical protein